MFQAVSCISIVALLTCTEVVLFLESADGRERKGKVSEIFGGGGSQIFRREHFARQRCCLALCSVCFGAYSKPKLVKQSQKSDAAKL